MEPLQALSGTPVRSPAPTLAPPSHRHLHHPAMVHQSWGYSCSRSPPTGTASYEANVVAASLLPSGDAWAHHAMLASHAAGAHWNKQEEESHAAPAPASSGDATHDDSGISPGRTSSSGGPPSSGGSPHANPHSPPRVGVKTEPQDAEVEMQSSPVTQDDDSSDASEDTMDSLSRLQMALSQSGSPLGDIYNAGSEDQHIQCPLCSQTTQNLPSLAAHLATHVENNKSSDSTELLCPVCSFATPNREEFVTHLSTHLPKSSSRSQSSRRCSVCDFSTKSASKLKAHLAEFHGFAPSENDAEMMNEEEDVTTPRVNSQGKVKTFRCKQCNFVAVTKLDFWTHSRCHIKSEKVLSCPKCPFVTEYKHHLEYHLRNHSGSKPFKCTQCSYSCVNKSMLNSHLKSHSNVYQYRCADCNYATKYCHSLKLHLRKYAHTPAMVLNPDGTPNPLPIIDVYGTRRGPKVKKDGAQHQQTPSQTPEARVSPRPPQKSPVNTMPAIPAQHVLTNPSPPAPADDRQRRCAQCDFSTTSQEHFAQHLLTAHHHALLPTAARALTMPPMTPDTMMHAQPLIIPQTNAMKEYLSWVYAHQQRTMDQLYQQHQYNKETEAVSSVMQHHGTNPLDLSKEIKKSPPPSELVYTTNNNISPVTHAPPNKSRRKGKAFKLERIIVEEKEPEEEVHMAMPPKQMRLTNGSVSINDAGVDKVKSPQISPRNDPEPVKDVRPTIVVGNMTAVKSQDRLPEQIRNSPPRVIAESVSDNTALDVRKRKSPSPVVPCSKSPPATSPNDQQESTYNCNYCDIIFRDVVMYTMHMGYHGYKDPFHCNMCGQQTSDKLSFFLHIARSSHC